MGVWQGLLIVLGCIVMGSLVGLLLLRLLRRPKKRDYSLLDQEAKTIKAANTAAPVTVKSKEITKSNGQEDPLEILLKNHKNGLTAENPKPPVAADNPGGVEITAQKNPPAVEKEEKPAPHIMHWTELVTPSDQLRREEEEKTHEMLAVKEPTAVRQKSTAPAVNEPTAVNQTSVPLAGEPIKAAMLSTLTESEIISQKTQPAGEKQKRVPTSAVPNKSETIIRKKTPIAKYKKKDTKPSVPEPDIIKQESVEQKSTELKPQESTNVEQKITPTVEKPESILKTELIIEMEANLVIASQPWTDKLNAFQTKCWDSKHGESDLFLNTHYQEMIQLYVDIGLANNIVWLATEIGHRTKELDESYIKLCSGITDIIKKILV